MPIGSGQQQQFLKVKRSDDEGLEWYEVSRNGTRVYHCMTEEMADKWIQAAKSQK
jgi:hypothetical protein